MRYLLLFLVFVAGCAKKETPIVDFDFQGLRLGDPAPARLKIKNPERDLVVEKIEGTRSDVWYTIMDGNVEALTIGFDDAYQAIEAYEKKFGVKPERRDGEAVWMTQHGEFAISKTYSNARIYSKKYSEDASAIAKKKLKELGSKL